jgi:hypothetical protein
MRERLIAEMDALAMPEKHRRALKDIETASADLDAIVGESLPLGFTISR